MTREEKERIQQKLHRAADAHLNAYGGNLYYEGVARGLEQAAGILGKVRCEDEVAVVRCEDCLHNHVTSWNHGERDKPECRFTDFVRSNKFYCGFGERRE